MRIYSFARIAGPLAVCGLISLVVLLGTSRWNSAGATRMTFHNSKKLTARVMGGRQPISNSSVLLSEASNSPGLQSNVLASTTTDGQGNFNIPSFTCQNAASQLFITANGGDAGNGYNHNILLVAMLGPCNNLPDNVVINELSTVAAAYSFSQFMDRSNPAQIGNHRVAGFDPIQRLGECGRNAHNQYHGCCTRNSSELHRQQPEFAGDYEHSCRHSGVLRQLAYSLHELQQSLLCSPRSCWRFSPYRDYLC